MLAIAPNPVAAIFAAISISLLTAIPHETAHMIFGRTIGQAGSLRIYIHQSVATTTLTHVWTWPMSARLAAVGAGLTVDLILLVTALTTQEIFNHWILTITVGVISMRIIWQLRFHRICDGRHIAKMLIDSPTIDQDACIRITSTGIVVPPVARVWIPFLLVGVLAELALFVVWIVPAILQLAGVL